MSYSIYALADPNTGIVHYIGITRRNVGRRYREHCRCSDLNLQKNIWIQQLLQKGQRPLLSTIEGGLSSEIAREREKIWIHTYRDLGLPLTNFESQKVPDFWMHGLDDESLESRLEP